MYIWIRVAFSGRLLIDSESDLELASRNPVEFIAVIKAVSAVNTVDLQGV